MSRQRMLAVGVIGILLAIGSLSAHHRWPVDQSTLVTVQGTVASYSWGNPHVLIELDVTTDDGQMEQWIVGGPSTSRMAANGWDRNTLQGGEMITGMGFQFSDGSKIVRLEKIVMADGSEILLYGRS